MPDPFYFLTFGGLGLSLAGFAGLIYFIDPRPEAQGPIATWRIRSIVEHGFACALAGLLTFPVFTWTQSIDATVRVVAAVLLLFSLAYSRWSLRPGPAWPDPRRRKIVMGIAAIQVAVLAINVAFAGVALLQFNLLLAFADGAGSFVNAVQDLKADPDVDDAAESQPPM